MSDFKETWIFSTDFGIKLKPSFIKIRRVGAELFHAEGRTDEANSRFSQFCEGTKIVLVDASNTLDAAHSNI